MKLTILDGHAVNPGDLPWDKFSDLADITVYERTPQELVINRIGDSDAILLNKVNITEEVFSTCQNLKYVGVLATGYNVVDIEAAKRHKVTVTNIPSYSTNSVAQHVFSLILNFTNQVELHNNSVHNGEWITCPDFCYWKSPLMELSGKTLGVFGYGMIGKKVTEIAKAFGMNVICCTRTAQDGMPKSVTFEQLMQLSDIVTLHAPLTEKTKNIINKASLKLMKKSAYLINTARGGFVVEQELADCLNAGQIAGYAADVVSQEPINKDSPLLTAKNCVITPHIAWSPLESRKRLQNIAYDNLKNFINGTPTNYITK